MEPERLQPPVFRPSLLFSAGNGSPEKSNSRHSAHHIIRHLLFTNCTWPFQQVNSEFFDSRRVARPATSFRKAGVHLIIFFNRCSLEDRHPHAATNLIATSKY